MKGISSKVRNEEGSVLVIAIMILVLLTIIGIATSTTSEVEIQIAGNEKLYKTVLYTADAGIEHVRAMLNARLMLDPANASGPVATIIQDIFSVTIFFLIASWLL